MIPSTCADEKLELPTNNDYFLFGSRSIMITRYFDEKKINIPFSKAVKDYLNIIGTGQANSMVFIKKNTNDLAEYKINIDDKFPAIVSTDKKELNDIESQTKDLVEIYKNIDNTHDKIIKLFGRENKICTNFEKAKQEFEWAEQKLRLGYYLPEDIQFYNGNKNAGDFISLVSNIEINGEQSKALKDLYNIKVSPTGKKFHDYAFLEKFYFFDIPVGYSLKHGLDKSHDVRSIKELENDLKILSDSDTQLLIKQFLTAEEAAILNKSGINFVWDYKITSKTDYKTLKLGKIIILASTKEEESSIIFEGQPHENINIATKKLIDSKKNHHLNLDVIQTKSELIELAENSKDGEKPILLCHLSDNDL